MHPAQHQLFLDRWRWRWRRRRRWGWRRWRWRRLDYGIADIVPGQSAQNRARSAQAGCPGYGIFVVAGVLVNCDSDSGAGARANQSADNRACAPTPGSRKIRASREHQENDKRRYTKQILRFNHEYPSKNSGYYAIRRREFWHLCKARSIEIANASYCSRFVIIFLHKKRPQPLLGTAAGNGRLVSARPTDWAPVRRAGSERGPRPCRWWQRSRSCRTRAESTGSTGFRLSPGNPRLRPNGGRTV
jgi:hypothetical protein